VNLKVYFFVLFIEKKKILTKVFFIENVSQSLSLESLPVDNKKSPSCEKQSPFISPLCEVVEAGEKKIKKNKKNIETK